MTCKVLFFNSIRENLKHHVASTFATALTFFIQFLVFFLQVQNLATQRAMEDVLNKSYIHNNLLTMTQPTFAYWTAILFVSIILAFDYFRYLHSKKQMDFYESLPVKRKDWFLQKTATSFIVFLIPYVICTISECLILFVYDFTKPSYFVNLLWNALCMILLFTITWLTAVLAMVMTGHPVIATFGFGVFCGYAPVILRYIYPIYAEQYFDSYVSLASSYSIGKTVLSLNDLTYISPIGLAANLLSDSYSEWIYTEHTKDFLYLILLIVIVSVVTYYLFLKRPSEAAGRAMAFEKFNPVIRIGLVIPLALYLGMYLSLVTNVGSEVWMVVGFILGVVLLHGIIESIFQFDIRGLWSHKVQMIICFAVTFGIAFTFWIDLFGYDKYMPDLEDVNVITLDLYNQYFDRYDDIDGLQGEPKEIAYQLVANAIEEDAQSSNARYMRVTYLLDNGKEFQRKYYLDTDKNADLLDKLYVTKEYKNDICDLYTFERDRLVSLEWFDHVTDYPLTYTDAQLDKLFETYLAELTPFTFTDMENSHPIGSFQISYKTVYGYNDSFSCYIFPEFEQTIDIMEELIENTDLTANYGPLDTPILERYNIHSIDIYLDEAPFYCKDPDIIEALKENLILADDFYQKNGGYHTGEYYDGTAEVTTYDGVSYISILLPIEALEPYLN